MLAGTIENQSQRQMIGRLCRMCRCIQLFRYGLSDSLCVFDMGLARLADRLDYLSWRHNDCFTGADKPDTCRRLIGGLLFVRDLWRRDWFDMRIVAFPERRVQSFNPPSDRRMCAEPPKPFG